MPSESSQARAQALHRGGDDEAALAESARALGAACALPSIGEAGRGDAGPALQAAFALPAAQLRPILPFFRRYGALAERSGIARRLEPALGDLARQLAQPATISRLGSSHAIAAMSVLGFGRDCEEPWADQVFDTLLVPWLLAAARHREFETALALEGLAYHGHTLRTESRARFAATTGRWIPGLAAHARNAAAAMGLAPRPGVAASPRRVALYVHRASLLAHVAVVLETLSAVARAGSRGYAFTVFVMDGEDAAMQQAFERCGVRVRYLDRGDGREWFARLLELREILARENFAACFWVSLITHLAVAFPMRVAPLQGWWAMKYHVCDVPEIDVRLAVENVVLSKRLEGHEWRTIGTASTSWVDPARAPAARALRTRFPEDVVVAASIGREAKLQSPPFLEAVARLLQRHPNLVFLWTGQSRHAGIQAHFESRGVAQRVHFEGWVDTRLYAQAIDLFLDSFPFPCGLALKEAMAAGKPAVLYRSEESLGTGVPGAITPVIEGTADAAPEVRARLERIFTAATPFDLYACAATVDDYVESASRLIADRLLRERCGGANRAFVETFLASPEGEARKFLDHLDEIFEMLPAGAESPA